MHFAEDALVINAKALEKVAFDHAMKMARRYMRFVKESNGFDGARYTMAEYLQKQGVRRDLIAEACRRAERAYGIA